MKKRIADFTTSRPDKFFNTFTIVSFGEDARDYRDYLVIKDGDEEGIIVDMDDGEAFSEKTDSMSYEDIEDFLRSNVDRSHHILRVIDGDGVEVSAK